jgi:hypothetical protein
MVKSVIAAIVAAALLAAQSPIVVPAGGNVQAALDAAQPGDIIQLQAGATFVGNFVLPQKSGTTPITLTSTEAPPVGVRVLESDASAMATLRSPNSGPALRTAPGAHDYRIEGVHVTAPGLGAVVMLGDGANTDPALTPRRFRLDRVVVRADPYSKNGIEANIEDFTLTNSHISGIRQAGTETHAVVAWNGPGPFHIENNYLEAGSIGVLFGGAAPGHPTLRPQNLFFYRNDVSRPVAWRTDGGAWAGKNLFELKNMIGAVVRGNRFWHNWPQAQNGYSILFTVRAHSTTYTEATVENVMFEHNVVHDVAMGINILGREDTTGQTSRVADRITIRNNLFYNVDHTLWGGNGAFLQLLGGPRNVQVYNNTVLHTGTVANLNNPPSEGFVLRDNLFRHNAYGIFGNGVGTGNPALVYVPGAVITRNVLAGGNANQYTLMPGNLFPTVAQLMAAFTDAPAHNYRQTTWPGVGADLDLLEAVRNGKLLPASPSDIRIQEIGQ